MEYNEQMAQIKRQGEAAERNLEEANRRAQRESEALDEEAQRHEEGAKPSTESG